MGSDSDEDSFNDVFETNIQNFKESVDQYTVSANPDILLGPEHEVAQFTETPSL
jgi:hypothetical protein